MYLKSYCKVEQLANSISSTHQTVTGMTRNQEPQRMEPRDSLRPDTNGTTNLEN
jgi:hypothetical protein